MGFWVILKVTRSDRCMESVGVVKQTLAVRRFSTVPSVFCDCWDAFIIRTKSVCYSTKWLGICQNQQKRIIRSHAAIIEMKIPSVKRIDCELWSHIKVVYLQPLRRLNKDQGVMQRGCFIGCRSMITERFWKPARWLLINTCFYGLIFNIRMHYIYN